MLAELRSASMFAHTIEGAFVITALFAVVGNVLRGVNRSGAVAGWVAAFLICSGGGLRAFALLVVLFAVTFVSTRLGRGRKLALGTAEKSDGRDAAQVLANIGVAALFAALYGRYPNRYLMVAFAAALAEAAADTVSSECGQALNASPRLVTTGASVPPGSNGAVSLLGTVCGALSALLMALVAAFTGMVAVTSAWVIAAAALAGMFVDSLLGATFEGPVGLNNNTVNLLGTLSAALLACWWAHYGQGGV